MQISNQDFFEVVDIETKEKKQFETARDVSLFLSGVQSVFFQIFKNGKEVCVAGIGIKNMKNFLKSV